MSINKIDISKNILPVIVIVDDSPIQVEGLIDQLKDKNYKINYFRKDVEAKEWLKSHLVDIILIDIALVSEKDTKGLDFAEACMILSPEAIRICISRRKVFEITSMDVLKALNLNIRDSISERLFVGFGDKSSPQEVIDLVEYSHRRICRSNRASILCRDETAKDLINTLVEKTLYTNEHNPVEVKRQFIEITRRLAYRHSMPPATIINIEKVGGGRSRTVVFSMEIKYGRLDYISRIIAKIGREELISQEREAYAKFVPFFMNHGTYPILESYSCLRELAGIAYGNLGTFGMKDLPPTLNTMFWELSSEKANSFISIVSNLILSHEGGRPKHAETIKQAYERRFKYLTSDDLNDRCRSALERISEIVPVTDRTQLKLADYSPLPREINHPMVGFVGDGVAFPPYLESIVHGDLHFDNIIFSDKSLERLFLIDFAHTGFHHIFLDYVVLETSARFQLGRKFVEQAIKARSEDSLIHDLLIMESILYSDAVGQHQNIDNLGEDYCKLIKFILAIRHAAASRGGKEANTNYFAGLGMTCLSVLGLPGKDKISKYIRSWIAVVAGINFHIANYERKVCSLWGSKLSKKSEDEIIKFSVKDVEPRLREIISRIISSAIDRINISEIERSNSLVLIDELISSLASILPLTYGELEKIVKQIISKEKNLARSKVIFKLGIGILAVQLEKEVKVPEKVKSTVSEIRQILSKIKAL